MGRLYNEGTLKVSELGETGYAELEGEDATWGLLSLLFLFPPATCPPGYTPFVGLVAVKEASFSGLGVRRGEDEAIGQEGSIRGPLPYPFSFPSLPALPW